MTFPESLHAITRFFSIDTLLATSGQPDEAQLAALAEAGFRTIINLALHDDPRYSLSDESGTVAQLGMRYVHIPVQFSTPHREDFERFVAAFEAARSERTLVHCAHNKRVPVFLALYRVLHEGWSRERAETSMREVWQPDAIWQDFFDEMLDRSAA